MKNYEIPEWLEMTLVIAACNWMAIAAGIFLLLYNEFIN